MGFFECKSILVSAGLYGGGKLKKSVHSSAMGLSTGRSAGGGLYLDRCLSTLGI